MIEGKIFMKKVWLSVLILSLMLGVIPFSAIANNGDTQEVQIHDKDATRALTAQERVEIMKEITSPSFNVQVAKKDGSVPEQLSYIIENVDTGEVLEKGETRNGRITGKIVVSQMVKEVAEKKGSNVNYTDYVLRVYNNDEEVYVMYFFSVPTFKTINSFLSNAKDKKIEDLLWIHKAHFKHTNHNDILQDVFRYEEENEELTLNLITDDEQLSSFSNTNQKLYLSTSCTLTSTSNANTAVGRITGNQNLEGQLDISSGANMKIDVGVNGNTSGSITKEITENYGAPHTPTSPSSRVIKGNYNYGEYDCHSRDIYPYNWTEVRAIQFQGPGGSSLLTGIDGSTPSGIVNTLDTLGYYYNYTVSNGYRFGNAVTVFGVTLGSEIAYSSAHQYSYLAKNNGSKLFDNGTSKKVWYSTPIN